MEGNHRCGNIGVAEEVLDRPDVDAAFQNNFSRGDGGCNFGFLILDYEWLLDLIFSWRHLKAGKSGLARRSSHTKRFGHAERRILNERI
jgi:hypothetical protein